MACRKSNQVSMAVNWTSIRAFMTYTSHMLHDAIVSDTVNGQKQQAADSGLI
jgi:hypothetical protein